MRAAALLPPALCDGLTVLACLPTTVNMCVVLTASAGGNVAAALFNAVVGNALGVVATPALLLLALGGGGGGGGGGGVGGAISLGPALLKLGKKV